jgi:hypothetical protein
VNGSNYEVPLCGGKKPLGRPRRRWEDIIKMGFKETCNNTSNLVDLAQDRDY